MVVVVRQFGRPFILDTQILYAIVATRVKGEYITVE